jgi:hypothetical protein
MRRLRNRRNHGWSVGQSTRKRKPNWKPTSREDWKEEVRKYWSVRSRSANAGRVAACGKLFDASRPSPFFREGANGCVRLPRYSARPQRCCRGSDVSIDSPPRPQ